MKFLHVAPFLSPACGGLTEAVAGLADGLRRIGHECVVAVPSNRRFPVSDVFRRRGIAVETAPLCGPGLVGFAPGWGSLVSRLASDADAVVIHSVWTGSVFAAGRAALRSGARVVYVPHGCLLPERLSCLRLAKAATAALFQRRHLRQADLLLAMCGMEAESIRSWGLDNPVCVAACGFDRDSLSGERDPEAFRRRAGVPPGAKVVLSLSRLQFIKGVDILIEAFSGIGAEGWHLVVAGPDERGTLAALRRVAARGGSADRIHFVGDVRGADKRSAFAAADLFALASRSENFGITVAEALYCGVPVATTSRTAWDFLSGIGGGWIAKAGDVASFRKALDDAIRAGSAARRASAAAGRDWVETNCRWEKQAEALVSALGARPAGTTERSSIR